MTGITADSTQVTADSTTVTADAGTTNTAATYTALVTSYHRDKPRFMATVAATVAPFADNQAVTSTIPEAFDLDTAVGAQLDVDGELIGASRQVPTPLPSVFFSFGVPSLGFGSGIWRGPYDVATGLTSLPDTVYRRVLKARAQLNRWDGAADSLTAILRSYLPDPASLIRVSDTSLGVKAPTPFSFGRAGFGFGEGIWTRRRFAFGNPGAGFGNSYWRRPLDIDTPPSLGMSYRICIANKIPSNLDLAVLGTSVLPLRATGADISILVTTQDRSPLFGFGPQSANVAGFGNGAWGRDPLAVAALRT